MNSIQPEGENCFTANAGGDKWPIGGNFIVAGRIGSRHAWINISRKDYPEMPMTTAGCELPSFNKHQLSLVLRNRASSICSCRKIGSPLHWISRTILAMQHT